MEFKINDSCLDNDLNVRALWSKRCLLVRKKKQIVSFSLKMWKLPISNLFVHGNYLNQRGIQIRETFSQRQSKQLELWCLTIKVRISATLLKHFENKCAKSACFNVTSPFRRVYWCLMLVKDDKKQTKADCHALHRPDTFI